MVKQLHLHRRLFQGELPPTRYLLPCFPAAEEGVNAVFNIVFQPEKCAERLVGNGLENHVFDGP